jgi:monoamine oxidase
MDAGREQRFARVDVADADDDGLIHHEHFHRRAAPARTHPEDIAIEVVRQRFRAKTGKQFMRFAARLPKLATETARIGETQDASGIESPIDVVVRADRHIGRQHAQRAGHAQVQQRAARRRVREQVFRAALDRFDALTRQQFD